MTEVTIPPSFLSKVEALSNVGAQIRWYYCVMVNLAALNYPTLIPSVYDHMTVHVMQKLSHDKQFSAARKLREAFIKGTGIQGAAKVNTRARVNMLRLMSSVT